MKLLYFIQIIFLAIALTGCTKGELTFYDNDASVAEIQLNTLFNIKEIKDGCPVSPGGFIISGVRNSKVTISLLDVNFGTIWQNDNYDWGKLFYSGGFEGAFYSVEVVEIFQTGNGNYVCFCSVTEGGGVVWNTCLIVTLDKYGNQISKTELEHTPLYSVARTADNGYLLFGISLIKLNPDLSIAWERTDQNYAFSGAHKSPMYDDGFAVTGTWNSEQVYLQKFNETGELQWTRRDYNKRPFNDLGYDVRQLADKGFLIIGRTRRLSEPWDMNSFMIRTGFAGDTLWTKKFGTGSNEWLEEFVYASDNDFVIKETVGYPGDQLRKSILYRINGNGEIIDKRESEFFKLLYTSPGYFVRVEKKGDNTMKFSKIHFNDLFAM